VDYCAAKAGSRRLGIGRMSHYLYRTLAKGEIAPMSRYPELAGLERKHAALELEIATELARPGTNTLKVTELKRRKLQLKDEIERLRIGEASSVH
jgi:hypothetical protein